MIGSLLIVKTSSLGDVVHNLPAVTDIRARFPYVQIDWAVEEPFAEIPALHPAVRRVIPVAMRRWRKNLWHRDTWREIGALRRALRAQAYDAVIDTQGLLKSALIARWPRAPHHGQDRASVREPLAALFYDRVHAVARGQHAVTRNRELVARALGYPVPDTPPDYGIASPKAPLAVDLPTNYIVFLHGTSRDSKLWPELYWIELGQALAERHITAVLTWGSETERERAERLAHTIPGARVLPRLRLNELAGMFGRARAVVGVDSGLTHLAVALNVPTVALYTDTSPVLTGVLPADPERALNLGERDVVPTATETLSALATLRVL
jgi:heptosyltransferase-1